MQSLFDVYRYPSTSMTAVFCFVYYFWWKPSLQSWILSMFICECFKLMVNVACTDFKHLFYRKGFLGIDLWKFITICKHYG